MIVKNNILYIKFFVILILLSQFVFAKQIEKKFLGYAGNLSGSNSFENTSFIEGATLFFNHSESNYLKFIINDTGDNKSKITTSTIDFVINNDYNYLFGFEDNASLISMLPFICLNDFNLFFPLGASDILYKYPNNQHVFLNRKSFTDEITNLSNYIIKQNYQNIGIMYELNHVGVEMIKSFSSYLVQHDKSIFFSSGYNLNKSFFNNIPDYANLFLQQDLDLILVLANSEVSSAFIQNIRSSGSRVDIALLSLTNFDRIKEILSKKNNLFNNLIFSDIYDFNINQLYFYDEFMAYYSYPYNSLSYGGYISAKLLDTFLTFKTETMSEGKSYFDIFDRFKQNLKSKNVYHHYFSEQFYLIKVDQHGHLQGVYNES